MMRVRKRLMDRRLELVLTDRAKTFLAREGYDPVFGARPLKRVIQRDILNPLAVKLLEGDFKEGDVIEVDLEGGQLVFRPSVLQTARPSKASS